MDVETHEVTVNGETYTVTVETLDCGSSDLQAAGIPFTDQVKGRDIIRTRDELPASVTSVSIKSETPTGGGQVYLNGVALAEIAYDQAGRANPFWVAASYSRANARKIAKRFGVSLGES